MAATPMPFTAAQYQFPGNSHAKKSQSVQKSQPPTAAPVISGARPNPQKKIGKNIFAEKGRNAWEATVNTVIWPNIKRVILDVGNTLLQSLLYGAAPVGGGGTITPFMARSFFSARTQPVNQYQTPVYSAAPPQARSGGPPEGVDADIDEIEVQSPEDAKAWKEAALEYIKQYGQISVSTLLEMAQIQAPYTGNEWGYYTLVGTNTVRRGNKWYIRFPTPVYLKQE